MVTKYKDYTEEQKEKRRASWRKSYAKRRAAAKQYAKERYQRNKKKAQTQLRARRLNEPEQIILVRARASAKKKGISFDLSKEDIVIPKQCPILNIPLQIGNGQRTDNSPSLDRIDNSLGYIKSNVHVISMRANRIKNDATLQELKSVVKYLDSVK